MNAPANKSRAMRTIQTINTADNSKRLGVTNKKRGQASKATPVQDKENIKHELSGVKKGGKNKKPKPSSKATPVQDKENIKHELSGDKKVIDKTKKTNDEDYDFIVHGIIPPGYWKEIAEKRQLAIEETAKENEELYEHISIMKTELVKMKNMANRTDLLEEILKKISDYLNDDEVDEVDLASCQQLGG